MRKLPDGGISVVLGPGFAPGLAALGVLAELEERGVPIRRIVGVNTGALAAALWAVGSDLAFAARVLASLPWPRYAVARDLSGADPLLSALNILTHRADFHKARAPLTVVAADEATGQAVAIEKGSIAWAVRGSMAVPGLFHPLEDGMRRLVDGGSVWPLVPETVEAGQRSGRHLVVVHRAADPMGDAESGGFSLLHRQMALLAQKSWGQARPVGGELLAVSAEAGGLLDFHRAEEWFEAGRRAFRAWLSPSGGGIEV